VNLSETALMLAQIQAYDQRTVGESDVIAWHSLLADAPFEDCQEAVRQHYAEHTDRIMPAHVRRLVRGMASQREMTARATGWAPGQAGVPKDQALPEVTSGERLALSDLPAAVADLVARVRAELPEGSREALRPRAVAWEREHRAYLRVRDGEPNPSYRPDPAKSIVGHRYDADRKDEPCQVILHGLDPANVCGYPESEHAYSAWVDPA
jgi:hypothetical protein